MSATTLDYLASLDIFIMDSLGSTENTAQTRNLPRIFQFYNASVRFNWLSF